MAPAAFDEQFGMAPAAFDEQFGMAPAFPARDHEPGIARRPNRPRKSLIQGLISLRFLE